MGQEGARMCVGAHRRVELGRGVAEAAACKSKICAQQWWWWLDTGRMGAPAGEPSTPLPPRHGLAPPGDAASVEDMQLVLSTIGRKILSSSFHRSKVCLFYEDGRGR